QPHRELDPSPHPGKGSSDSRSVFNRPHAVCQIIRLSLFQRQSLATRRCGAASSWYCSINQTQSE
ncbi:Hypothetical predicted protein, partial [Podarcis lilfordi]